MEALGIWHLWKSYSMHLKTEKEWLQVFFNSCEYSVWEPMEDQELASYPSHSHQLAARYCTAPYVLQPHWYKIFQALSLKLASQIHFCYVMHYIMTSFESPWYFLYLCILSPTLLSCGSLAGTAAWQFEYYNHSLILCTEEFLKYLPLTHNIGVKITDKWKKKSSAHFLSLLSSSCFRIIHLNCSSGTVLFHSSYSDGAMPS